MRILYLPFKSALLVYFITIYYNIVNKCIIKLLTVGNSLRIVGKKDLWFCEELFLKN